MFACTYTCQLTYIHTYTEIDTQMRTHMHVHKRCLRAHANAPAISGSLAGGFHASATSFGLPPVWVRRKKKTQRRSQRDHFWARIGSPPTSGGQTSVFLRFDSEQKMNTKKIATRPFLGSDRVPPHLGVKLKTVAHF